MTQEQEFLLDNKLNDLIISKKTEKDYKKWVYVSQALEKYKEKIKNNKGENNERYENCNI